jgi:hypothetical protein
MFVFTVVSPFRLRVSHHLDRAAFPIPATSNVAGGFPHYALLFASPQGVWDLSCWGDFRQRPQNHVAVEQFQVFVKPLATPPLPAEALLLPSHGAGAAGGAAVIGLHNQSLESMRDKMIERVRSNAGGHCSPTWFE